MSAPFGGITASRATAMMNAAMSPMQSDMTEVQTAVTDHETRLTAAEGDIDNLQTTDTSLDGRLDTAESNVTTLQSQMTTANSNITALQSPKSSRVLAALIGPSGNIDAGETDTLTYSMPANTLVGTGSMLGIRFVTANAANTNARTIKLYLGASSITVRTTSGLSTVFNHEVWIARKSDGNQRVIIVIGGTPAVSDMTENLANGLTIKITLQATATDDIVAESMSVELLPA